MTNVTAGLALVGSDPFVRPASVTLGAVCWGLVTYLGLLGCLLVGIGNPVATVVVPGDGETP